MPGTTSPSSARSRIPSATTSAARAAVRPDVGGLLPVFVLDRYEGYEVKLVQECTRAELDDWVERNAAAVREQLPADLVFCNHVLLGGPVGRGDRRPLRGQGARLGARVLDARQRGARGLGAGGARRRARPSSSAPRTSGRCWRTSSATSIASTRCRPASTSTSGGRVRAKRRSPGCSRRRGATRRTRGTRASGYLTRGTPSASPSSSPATNRPSSTSGSCSTTRASTFCSRRCASSMPAR